MKKREQFRAMQNVKDRKNVREIGGILKSTSVCFGKDGHETKNPLSSSLIRAKAEEFAVALRKSDLSQHQLVGWF